jgi:hypothetical protein
VRFLWGARLLVLVVLFSNLTAAVPFVLWPTRYSAAFELNGVTGDVVVRSIGLLFLMWVVPYIPVILAPKRHRTCLSVIVAQQVIGLAGESWMLARLPDGHRALHLTGTRFVVFDSLGLLLLLIAWKLTASSSET